MSGIYTEADYENTIIELFENMGWRHVYGPEAEVQWCVAGGIENGDVELIDDDSLYRTNAMDDQPIYYDLGTITLPVSTDCTFEDHAGLEQEPDGLVYEYEDVPSAIQNSKMPFNCYNTVITVRREHVVQIIRYWIP